jgi:hypothetical protein
MGFTIKFDLHIDRRLIERATLHLQEFGACSERPQSVGGLVV